MATIGAPVNCGAGEPSTPSHGRGRLPSHAKSTHTETVKLSSPRRQSTLTRGIVGGRNRAVTRRKRERALELGRWLQLVSALLPGLLIGANQDGQRGPWNVSVGIVKRAAKEKKGEQPQLPWAASKNVDRKESKAKG